MNEDADRIDGMEALRRDIEPGQDLWPGIATRMRPRRRAAVPYALAAGVAAAALAVGALLRLSPDPTPVPAVVEAAVVFLPTLTSDTRAIVVANLQMVRAAQRDLRAAIERTPDQPGLHRLLARAEQRQSALQLML